MAGNGVPVLLITANVGSIFEEVRACLRASTTRVPRRPRDTVTGEARPAESQPDRSIAHVDFVAIIYPCDTHDLLAAAAADAPFSSPLLPYLPSASPAGRPAGRRGFFVHTRDTARTRAVPIGPRFGRPARPTARESRSADEI